MRRCVFLSLLAGSYLQYYFLGVMTEIGSLPGIVVFLPSQATESAPSARERI